MLVRSCSEQTVTVERVERLRGVKTEINEVRISRKEPLIIVFNGMFNIDIKVQQLISFKKPNVL